MAGWLDAWTHHSNHAPSAHLSIWSDIGTQYPPHIWHTSSHLHTVLPRYVPLIHTSVAPFYLCAFPALLAHAIHVLACPIPVYSTQSRPLSIFPSSMKPPTPCNFTKLGPNPFHAILSRFFPTSPSSVAKSPRPRSFLYPRCVLNHFHPLGRVCVCVCVCVGVDMG